MNKFANLIILAMLLLFSGRSFAITCLKAGDIFEHHLQVNQTVAVPSDLPYGSMIWRSDEFAVSFSCWQSEVAERETVYLYLTPFDPTGPLLGPHIELGISINGKDTRCSQMNECKVKLDVPDFAGCNDPMGCKDKQRRVTLRFNLFLSKKSPPSTEPGGPITFPPEYFIAQIDGENWLNPIYDKNLRLYLTGLKIRHVGCSSTININPRVLNFGQIPAAAMKPDKPIKELPLTVTATRTCGAGYGLDATFKPTAGTVFQSTVLVPPNNKSVGIKLFRGPNKIPTGFNSIFELVKAPGAHSTVVPFTAQLVWMSNTAELGDFSAATTLEIYYK
ncbi:fimbrial protein [Achromobacter seleniivolatilans]|uniref:Fimbrial protein n=1 Tax=Achromobacter seleniivolatilans TaxID=3047478 RepID=A0ABY9LU65_9BURK|nr:fimbrial protein [Achromobacter sp. R39]WMD18311.1 fimbrial protein [Achromobacter sp. R39]